MLLLQFNEFDILWRKFELLSEPKGIRTYESCVRTSVRYNVVVPLDEVAAAAAAADLFQISPAHSLAVRKKLLTEGCSRPHRRCSSCQ